MNSSRKYIIIPEYRPLYAMHRCFGPNFGPLQKPTLTPIDVIGELLGQTGDNKLTIFEVEKLAENKFSPPVQLTLENYRLSYNDITGGKVEPKVELIIEPVIPVVAPAVEEIAPIAEEPLKETSEVPAEEVSETPSVEEEPADSEIVETVEEKAETEVKVISSDNKEPNPYAGMTKAERRAAKRADSAKDATAAAE